MTSQKEEVRRSIRRSQWCWKTEETVMKPSNSCLLFLHPCFITFMGENGVWIYLIICFLGYIKNIKELRVEVKYKGEDIASSRRKKCAQWKAKPQTQELKKEEERRKMHRIPPSGRRSFYPSDYKKKLSPQFFLLLIWALLTSYCV